jgi:hypothetical protein
MATIAVRLDRESEEALNRVARETGQTKSEIVREALIELQKRKPRKKAVIRPYDLMKKAIGCFNSGGLRLSERTGDKFYELPVADRKRKEELNREYYDALKKDLNELDAGRRRSTRRPTRR